MNEKDYLPLRLTCNGETKEFAYKWKTFNKENLIVQLESIANNQLTTLVLGKDYDVDIEDMGGNVILFNAPTDEYYINISRNTPQYQSKEFLTSSGFQASEVEKSFDKVSCNLQEMDYNIDTFKKDFTTEINKKFSDFSDEYQDTIDTVNQAVEKMNTLDSLIESCNDSAQKSQQAAEALVLHGVKKEVHILPTLSEAEDGYYWTINHEFGHNNFACKLYSVANNTLLWGEPHQITNEKIVYKFSKTIEAGTIKAILIG